MSSKCPYWFLYHGNTKDGHYGEISGTNMAAEQKWWSTVFRWSEHLVMLCPLRLLDQPAGSVNIQAFPIAFYPRLMLLVINFTVKLYSFLPKGFSLKTYFKFSFA